MISPAVEQVVTFQPVTLESLFPGKNTIVARYLLKVELLLSKKGVPKKEGGGGQKREKVACTIAFRRWPRR